MSNYIISGGAEGKSRLNLLSETLHPYTVDLLSRLGVIESKTFLDVGCGGGNVTMLASQMVGATGHVTGIDFDEEIINLAREDARKSGADNVTFLVKSAYDIEWRNEYDFAYARFLLSHLQSPFEVLQKMVSSVKPGALVVAEDIHFSGHVCYPECKSFDLYVELFKKAAFNNGHNPEIGPSLYSLFVNAGLKNIGFDVILPCYNAGPGKWMAHITLDRIKPSLLKQGLATEEQIHDMLEELEIFTKDEKTIMSLPHIFRVWGVKE
jgi:ubiquinone/menaquinone biosynthesis C-methylase UbiE